MEAHPGAADAHPGAADAHNGATEGNPGESYHISTNDTVSIRGLVEKICDLTNTSFSDLVNVSDDRLGKDQAYLLDSNKLRNDFSWQNEINLEEGVIKLWSTDLF